MNTQDPRVDQIKRLVPADLAAKADRLALLDAALKSRLSFEDYQLVSEAAEISMDLVLASVGAQ